MKNDINFNNLGDMGPRLKAALSNMKHYYATLFIVVVAGLYIFLLFQINIMVNKQPDKSTIKTETAQKLKVDEAVVQQLKTLRDNSVNVQALINDTRNNPFQE